MDKIKLFLLSLLGIFVGVSIGSGLFIYEEYNKFKVAREFTSNVKEELKTKELEYLQKEKRDKEEYLSKIKKGLSEITSNEVVEKIDASITIYSYEDWFKHFFKAYEWSRRFKNGSEKIDTLKKTLNIVKIETEDETWFTTYIPSGIKDICKTENITTCYTQKDDLGKYNIKETTVVKKEDYKGVYHDSTLKSILDIPIEDMRADYVYEFLTTGKYEHKKEKIKNLDFFYLK